LTRAHRWASPLFLVGVTAHRAAGPRAISSTRGAFNGIVLVSSILTRTASSPGQRSVDVLYLPTYTATAWYHKQPP
jgi:hypothetical protein